MADVITLEDILFEDEKDVMEKEDFAVTDMDTANWAFKMYADSHYKVETLKAKVKEWKRRLDDWLKSATAEYDKTMEVMQYHLEPYVRESLNGGKKKSIPFLGGKAGFRTTPQTVNITDEAALIEWAEKNAPEAVKKTISKSAIAPYVKGGIVPGAELVDGEERFYITPDKVKEIPGNAVE